MSSDPQCPLTEGLLKADLLSERGLSRGRAAGDPFVAPMMYRDDGRLNVGFVVFFMSYVIIVVTPSQTPRLAPPRPAAFSLLSLTASRMRPLKRSSPIS